MSTLKKPKAKKLKQAKEKLKKAKQNKGNNSKDEKPKATRQRNNKRMGKHEKFKEDMIKNANWLKGILIDFATAHYVVTAVAVSSFLFLLILKCAVEIVDERHPSNHPNITDHVSRVFEIVLLVNMN